MQDLIGSFAFAITLIAIFLVVAALCDARLRGSFRGGVTPRRGS